MIQGIGINDAGYATGGFDEKSGKYWTCPFYSRWKEMLARCYSERFHETKPTYIGCEVCDEWLLFSNFKKWMETQDWRGKHLDKDILVNGNKVYSPETCVFVSSELNAFTTERGRKRGEFMIGVCFHKRDRKFQSNCKNPIIGKKEYLGSFLSEVEAHNAWRKRKLEIIKEMGSIGMIKDERVLLGLMRKYEQEDNTGWQPSK